MTGTSLELFFLSFGLAFCCSGKGPPFLSCSGVRPFQPSPYKIYFTGGWAEKVEEIKP